ncbi:MFS general substrate transporter [Aspergillus candidus]|uniref:Citrate exporter 1 n=1 Tax=Aspergillus candidus TaxID=41067 RepID=A0A2I2FIB0_ASPCN|nr:MFS general substrate transporter [Aspergillus candidus]PLB40365.1 MFS general substrate transporter [Aspergillus candidus]
MVKPTDDEEYSAFGRHEKRFMVFMAAVGIISASISSHIYFPVMPTLIHDYNITPALLNLTITSFMIIQGLAPSFIGTFSDANGRRPAYILAFAIYFIANIGLSVQNSYGALLALRCIQSAGSSGSASFGHAVVADIAPSSIRGKYIGPMTAGVTVTPALGPVIGGILTRYLGWRSVFWFLVIISGTFLVAYVVLMPETARKVVGNGRVTPTAWWRQSVAQAVSARRKPHLAPRDEQPFRLTCPNPLETLVIFREKDMFITILYIGIGSFTTTVLGTSTANLFGDLYDLDSLQIGLCYLPFGVAATIGAMVTGKVLDYNYRRIAHQLNIPPEIVRSKELLDFPIERARLQIAFAPVVLLVAAFLPYGWVLQLKLPLAVPLVLQCVIGFTSTICIGTMYTLLVDLAPAQPATASAAANLMRCWLGALGAGIIDVMLRGMGWGWCFVFLGLVIAAASGLLALQYVHGLKWREQRKAREDEKQRKEAATGS